MILLIGDTHGQLQILKDSVRVIQNNSTDQNNYILVCGDFGFVWNTQSLQKYNDFSKDLLNIDILFVDGNHQNFTMLNNLIQINRFNSVVGKVNSNTFHLKRGNIYSIQGKTFFIFGGASSVDKLYRLNNVSWWQEQQAKFSEMCNAVNNLQNHNNSIDYVISHTCPQDIYNNYILNYLPYKIQDSCNVRQFLNHIYKELYFKHWYFGHFHIDMQFGNYTCLYKDQIIL